MYDSLIEDRIFGNVEPEDLDRRKQELDLELENEAVDLGSYEDDLMEI